MARSEPINDDLTIPDFHKETKTDWIRRAPDWDSKRGKKTGFDQVSKIRILVDGRVQFYNESSISRRGTQLVGWKAMS